MRIRRLVVPAVVSLLLSSEAAAADNPAQQACEGKSKGAACTFSKPHKDPGGALEQREVSGACQDDECCELDYSKGSPPASNCGPCLVCKEGAAAEPSAEGGAAANPGPNAEPPRPGDDPPAAAGNGKRGCSMGTRSAIGLLLLPLLVLLRRRAR
jgi:hypothetical protein